MTTVYTKPNCPDCEKTKSDMDAQGVAYRVVDMFADKVVLKKIKDMGFRKAPVVMTENGDQWSGYKPEKISNLSANLSDAWDF